MIVDRRGLLRGAVAGLACARSSWPRRARAAGPRFTDHPFQLGVTSGWIGPTSAVLWTRLAPEPLRGGGMPDRKVQVRWEVGEDESFRKIVRKGVFFAIPELAHSVHAEVEGLSPGRTYFYRFFAGAEVSPVGRTRTLPDPSAPVERLKLGYGSCQHFEHGYYAAHRHLLEEELDLMVFLGDYIYESTWGEDLVRAHSGGGSVARTLRDYRDRHAQYKTDPDLQALHGAVPWVLTWDDHEVANDYASLRSERLEPDFRARRQAGYQAFWEHMPLPMSLRPVDGRMRIRHALRFGRLAELFVLDGRQHKTPQACPKPGLGGGNLVETCEAVSDPDRSFLGAEQEGWLDRGLKKAGAAWNVVAQQTVFAPIDRKPGEGDRIWTDGWDGYPAARRRLIRSLRRSAVEDSFIIGGDVHCAVAADVREDPEDPDSPIVSSELCGTSIASQGPSQDRLDALRPDNPHVHLAQAGRGYCTLELRPGRATAAVRILDDVTRPDSGIETVARFTAEAGRPGLQKG